MRRLLLILPTLLIAACGSQAPATAPAAPSTAQMPSPAAAATTTYATPETEAGDAIGFATVAAARAALAAREDVDSREDGGWTIVADPQAAAFWSFAPEDHAAFPAVVKRTIHETDVKVAIALAVLCEGAAPACAELKRKFDDLDERMRADLQKQADARNK